MTRVALEALAGVLVRKGGCLLLFLRRHTNRYALRVPANSSVSSGNGSNEDARPGIRHPSHGYRGRHFITRLHHVAASLQATGSHEVTKITHKALQFD